MEEQGIRNCVDAFRVFGVEDRVECHGREIGWKNCQRFGKTHTLISRVFHRVLIFVV